MPEAKINESCIIGLPACGYAFNSSRMAFIATPADEEFSLELEILQNLLQEKEYETYIAFQRTDPAKLAFCTKICSRIITSQFCIVLLNRSSHRDHPKIKMPNPNVHMEYGLMLAFRKYILPFQRKGEELAFNIQPLDTILYSKGKFKTLADRNIDEAIMKVGPVNRGAPVIPSSLHLLKYMFVRGVRVTELNSPLATHWAKLANPLGFILLDGQDILYFGVFDSESAKEVVFRLKMLLQTLNNERRQFETAYSKEMTPEQIANSNALWQRFRIEVILSDEVDKEKVREKIESLTTGFYRIPWKLLHHDDVKSVIDQEYESIGEI